MSVDIGSLSKTWNSAGTSFVGIGINVTDVASAADSYLINIRLGGTAKLRFTKAGVCDTAEGLPLLAATNTFSGSNSFSGQLTAGSDLNIGATDIKLVKDATGILAQRSGTQAQAQRVYRTYTDPSNYAYNEIAFNGTRTEFRTIAAGSGGTAGDIDIVSNGVTFRFQSGGGYPFFFLGGETSSGISFRGIGTTLYLGAGNTYGTGVTIITGTVQQRECQLVDTAGTTVKGWLRGGGEALLSQDFKFRWESGNTVGLVTPDTVICRQQVGVIQIDNAVLLTNVTAASLTNPPAGKQILFLDSSNNNKLSLKDSAGTVTAVH